MLDIELVKELLGGLLLRPCLMGAFVFLGACFLCCLWRFCRTRLGGLWLRSRSQFVALVIAAGIATGVAQKSTNNVPPNLNSPLPQMMQGDGSFQSGFTGLSGVGNLVNPVQNQILVQITSEDIARGWRIESVMTNSEPFAAMPSNAEEYAKWSLRGGREMWFPLEFGGFEFPIGTNRIRRLRVLSGGAVETFSPNEPAAIYAAREYASLIPGYSRFLWADSDDGTEKTFRWEGVYANRDRTGEYDAEIKFYANGDFTTKSNEVETVCRRVNPDDWDDDGIHNERDLNPTSYDGDFFGVANALPTNANPDAYYWLDLSVTGLLGVATIRVTCDGPSDLGDHLIIARTNQVCHIPILAGATYAVESDLPIDYSVVSSEYAHIVTNAENRLVVSLPLEFSLARTSSGDALTANYILQCAPFNVGATLSSLSGVCCLCETNAVGFVWVCSDGCTCGGQHEISTAAAWEGYSLPFSWWGTCGCYIDVTETSSLTSNGINLLIEMPSTFIANDDDDNNNGIVDATPPFGDYEDEVVSGRVSFASMTLTNGIVKLQKLTGLEQGTNGTRRVYADESGLSPIGEGHEYAVENTAFMERDFFVNPVMVSSHYQDGCVRVLWKPDSGPRSAVSKRFTIVEPTVEPITDDSWSLADFAGDGRLHSYLYNPCAVVVGQTARFKVDVLPEDYPDSKIVWTTNMCEGAVRFVGSNVNTGRVVTVEGVSTGDVFLVVKFGDAESPQPAFFSKVVQPMTVRLRAWIVGDGSSWARTQDDVRNMVSVANDIYSQAGVNLELVEPIVLTNITAAYNVTYDEPEIGKLTKEQLVGLNVGTGALECYFINCFVDKPQILGMNCESGMVMTASADGRTLAHEIGHAFGLEDIYVSNVAATNEMVTLKAIPPSERPRYLFMESDWNLGCEGHGEGGCRFYGKTTMHSDIIDRMLMNGMRHGHLGGGRDITMGNVHGVWYEGDGKTDGDWKIDLAPVGFFTNVDRSESPVHQ